MSTDAGNPSGNGINSGAGTGTPAAGDSANVTALVNETINKAMSAWMRRLDDKVKAVDELASKLSAPAVERQEPTAPVAGNDAGGEKLSLKALHEQIANLTKAVDAERQARAKAEAGARDVRLRTEVERRLTAKLGADNPLVGTLMDSLYDVKKRFVEDPSTGRLSVKFSDNGYDELRPLDEGVDALFTGELKHLVSQSRAAALPPSGYRPGVPVNGPRAPQGTNPVAAQLAATLAAPFAAYGEQDKAQQMIDAFVSPANPPQK